MSSGLCSSDSTHMILSELLNVTAWVTKMDNIVRNQTLSTSILIHRIDRSSGSLQAST